MIPPATNSTARPTSTTATARAAEPLRVDPVVDENRVRGIRFDFSKGTAASSRHLHPRAAKFSVGKYWDTLNYGQGLEWTRTRIANASWIDRFHR